MPPATSFQFRYQIGGVVYTCDFLAEDCGQMTVSSWQTTFMTCKNLSNGKSQRTAFWITSDGWYNINADGQHAFCCGVKSSSRDDLNALFLSRCHTERECAQPRNCRYVHKHIVLSC
jgi:hypothetical protein